jgi:hypothetical protein
MIPFPLSVPPDGSRRAFSYLLPANRRGIEHVDGAAARVGENLIDDEPIIKLVILTLDVPKMRRDNNVINFKKRLR